MALELPFTIFALFCITMVASYLFYNRLKMAQNEYENSKESVRNITFGFTRQTKRIEAEINQLESEAQEVKIMATEAVKLSQGSSDATLKGLEKVRDINNRVNRIEDSIKEMKKDIQELAKQPRTIVQPVSAVDAAIPLKEQDVLTQLTETELEVLKIITDLGEGTVPELREKIDKTREHTARLLKKLYDRGYIDRNTSRMPYRYHVRKEITDLINQQKEPAPASL